MHPNTTSRSARLLSLLAAISAPSISLAQTWSAPGDGNWSVNTNWTPNTVPGAGNTTTLGDITANRTVTYDSGASGTVGTLTIDQTTAGFTNAVNLQRSLILQNALALGASAGTEQVIVGSTASSGFSLTSSNGVTLNSGGVLALSATTNTLGTGFNAGSTNANTAITVSGGTVLVQASTGNFTTGAASNTVNGNLSMTDGIIRFDNVAGTAADRRLDIRGNVNISGGAITADRSSALLQFLSSANATITLNPTTFESTKIGLNLQSNFTQALSTNQTLGAIAFRGTGVKSLTSTASGNGIGALTFWDTDSATPGSAATLRLGSNLTLNSGANQPSVVISNGHSHESGRIDAAINTNGFILDLAVGASGGVWTPPASTQSGVTNTVWSLSGNGTVRANAFSFTTANVTTNVGAGLVLNAAGTNNTASNLGSVGTIDGTSIFRYSGNAVIATPATLTWSRNIGQIEVSSGALRLSTNATVGAGVSKIRVGGGATLLIGSETNLGTAPSTPVADYLTLDGGTLSTTGSVSAWNANRGIVLGAAGGVFDARSAMLTTEQVTGNGTLTKNGIRFYWAGNNTFSGGFILNEGWIRPRAYSTVVNGVVTGSPVGTGTLTINGGGLSGASGYSPTYFVTQTNVAADFAVNSGAIGTGQNKMVNFAGPINLLGAQRTVSLGSYTTAAASIASPYIGTLVELGVGGSCSLNFISADGILNTVVSNGTLRFVRESLGGEADFVALNFHAATFAGGAGLTIGSNVITTMSQDNPFGEVAGNQPAVTVETGGYFNLANADAARSPQIRSLAGSGVVTSLAPGGASTLVINAQTGDNATFAGQILDGSALNSTLGTTSAATIALLKAGAGTQVLSGLNAYSGDTTVSDGTLSLQQAGLADGADVVINGSGKLGLNFSGTDTVRSLYIGGVQQPAGVYGAAGSGAANVNNAVFIGTGRLSVASGPVVTDPFASWTTSFGLGGASAAGDANPDNDSLPNLLEWVVGGNPTLADAAALQPQVSQDSTYLKLVFSRADETESAVALVARWGVNLTSWTDVAVGAVSSGPDANGVLVTVAENGSSADTITVSVPLTNAVAGRLFISLRATKN